MKQYKAIGFDFSGVIGGDKHGYGQHGNYTERVCQVLDVDIATYRKVYFSLNHLINTGQGKSWQEFGPILLRKLNRLDKLDVYNIFLKSVESDQRLINPDMVKLVDQLRTSGYKVGLLSNNIGVIATSLRKQGIEEHFDAVIFSGEVGLQKPDPAIFELFAHKLGVSLSDLIYIDDSERSLSTARECGYTPILFTSRRELEKALQKLGITY